MEPTLKEAIDLYQSQVEIVNALWTFFGTVTLAVVGFTIGSDKATHSVTEVTMIIAGYAAFALAGNLTALLTAYSDLLQFSALIDNRVTALRDKVPAMHFGVPSLKCVVAFHVGIVVIVCISIIMYYRSRRDARSRRGRDTSN